MPALWELLRNPRKLMETITAERERHSGRTRVSMSPTSAPVVATALVTVGTNADIRLPSLERYSQWRYTEALTSVTIDNNSGGTGPITLASPGASGIVLGQNNFDQDTFDRIKAMLELQPPFDIASNVPKPQPKAEPVAPGGEGRRRFRFDEE